MALQTEMYVLHKATAYMRIVQSVSDYNDYNEKRRQSIAADSLFPVQHLDCGGGGGVAREEGLRLTHQGLSHFFLSNFCLIFQYVAPLGMLL